MKASWGDLRLHVFLSAGWQQHAEGFSQRESVSVQSSGPAEPAEPSQNRAESAAAKQRGGSSQCLWVFTLDTQTVDTHVLFVSFRWSVVSRVSCRTWGTDWSTRTRQTAVCRTTFISSKPPTGMCSVILCLRADGNKPDQHLSVPKSLQSTWMTLTDRCFWLERLILWN